MLFQSQESVSLYNSRGAALGAITFVRFKLTTVNFPRQEHVGICAAACANDGKCEEQWRNSVGGYTVHTQIILHRDYLNLYETAGHSTNCHHLKQVFPDFGRWLYVVSK